MLYKKQQQKKHASLIGLRTIIDHCVGVYVHWYRDSETHRTSTIIRTSFPIKPPVPSIISQCKSYWYIFLHFSLNQGSKDQENLVDASEESLSEPHTEKSPLLAAME